MKNKFNEKQKKRILFTNYNMDIGGIEKSLVNLVNTLDHDKYDVTILLQHKEGGFLEHLDSRVKVESFNLSKSKNILLRKIKNFIKIHCTYAKYHNKYDFSACFCTAHKASSLAALKASRNNAKWMHTNITEYMMNVNNHKNRELAKKQAKRFLSEVKFRKFKNYVFVSEDSLNTYLELYPKEKDKCILCYNLVDYKSIISMSKEKIKETKDKTKINFVNIGRHSEHDKKLTRIINAVNNLKNKYPIHVYMVGDGPEHQLYKDIVKKLKLEENIEFIGAKIRPFPYYLLGDATIISSSFEGFPTVYTESLTLNIPIITTDVSDAKKFISEKYGIVCSDSAEAFEQALEQFIKNKYVIKSKFDPIKYNKKSMEIIERLINHE